MLDGQVADDWVEALEFCLDNVLGEVVDARTLVAVSVGGVEAG